MGRESDTGQESSNAAVPSTGGRRGDCRFSGSRILLAEDSRDTRYLVRLLLERVGVEVDEAENGLVAWQRATAAVAAGRAPDLILMDMQMPGMDGYEATRRLRDGGWRGPIVALTADTWGESTWRTAGCDGCLPKPFTLDTLCETLARYLKQATPGNPPEATAPASPVDDPRIPSAQRDKLRGDFLASLPDRFEALAETALRGTLAEVRAQAHTLAGDGALLGYREVAEAARQIERHVRQGGTAEALAPLVETLANACTRELAAGRKPDNAG